MVEQATPPDTELSDPVESVRGWRRHEVLLTVAVAVLLVVAVCGGAIVDPLVEVDRVTPFAVDGVTRRYVCKRQPEETEYEEDYEDTDERQESVVVFEVHEVADNEPRFDGGYDHCHEEACRLEIHVRDEHRDDRQEQKCSKNLVVKRQR